MYSVYSLSQIIDPDTLVS